LILTRPLDVNISNLRLFKTKEKKTIHEKGERKQVEDVNMSTLANCSHKYETREVKFM